MAQMLIAGALLSMPLKLQAVSLPENPCDLGEGGCFTVATQMYQRESRDVLERLARAIVDRR